MAACILSTIFCSLSLLFLQCGFCGNTGSSWKQGRNWQSGHLRSLWSEDFSFRWSYFRRRCSRPTWPPLPRWCFCSSLRHRIMKNSIILWRNLRSRESSRKWQTMPRATSLPICPMRSAHLWTRSLEWTSSYFVKTRIRIPGNMPPTYTVPGKHFSPSSMIFWIFQRSSPARWSWCP